jgi:hypothetical protein
VVLFYLRNNFVIDSSELVGVFWLDYHLIFRSFFVASSMTAYCLFMYLVLCSN